jgi:hypothetical protein
MAGARARYSDEIGYARIIVVAFASTTFAPRVGRLHDRSRTPVLFFPLRLAHQSTSSRSLLKVCRALFSVSSSETAPIQKLRRLNVT